MKINEETLDQLHALQQKRIHDIANHGENFEVSGTSKTFSAIKSSNSTITAEQSAPIRPGILIKNGYNEYYVTACKSIAGAISAEVLPVSGTYTPMVSSHVKNLQTGTETLALKASALELPHLGTIGEAIRVPVTNRLSAGDVIQLSSGSLFKVTSIKRDGATNIASLAPHELPNTQQREIPAHFKTTKKWQARYVYE